MIEPEELAVLNKQAQRLRERQRLVRREHRRVFDGLYLGGREPQGDRAGNELVGVAQRRDELHEALAIGGRAFGDVVDRGAERPAGGAAELGDESESAGLRPRERRLRQVREPQNARAGKGHEEPGRQGRLLVETRFHPTYLHPPCVRVPVREPVMLAQQGPPEPPPTLAPPALCSYTGAAFILRGVSTTATAGRRRRGAGAIESPARTRSSPLPDLLIAIALGALAFLLRLNFPTDGLFHDDAWQVLGVSNGTFSDFPMVGQAQPGFTFALMVWERLFGSGTTSMLTPALIAGALGPPALYLALRHFGYARSIATLLGAMLTVAATHILFSNRVKTYTADVLVVLLFAVLLPPLARRRWSTRFGVLWFAGSVLAASFSSFALLASVSAGLILVLHAHGDRRVRVVAVAAQCAALVGYLLVVERTYSSRALRGFWSGKDAFISFSANPITLLDEILDHGLRVTQVFPGGGRAWEWVFLVVAVVGLIASARRGPRRLPARFLGLTAALAFAGAVIHRVPFGPQTSGDGGRVTLWLVPVLAFGIAAVLEFVRRRAARANAASCPRRTHVRSGALRARERRRRDLRISGGRCPCGNPRGHGRARAGRRGVDHAFGVLPVRPPVGDAGRNTRHARSSRRLLSRLRGSPAAPRRLRHDARRPGRIRAGHQPGLRRQRGWSRKRSLHGISRPSGIAPAIAGLRARAHGHDRAGARRRVAPARGLNAHGRTFHTHGVSVTPTAEALRRETPKPAALVRSSVTDPRVVLPVVAIAAVVGVLVATTRYGIGLTPDSVVYITGARSLANGRGYTHLDGGAIGSWPPGYSFVLSLGERIGIDALDGAVVLSAVSLVATVLLTYVLLRRHVRSPGVRTAGIVAVGCSAVLLEIFSKALSEHLFIPVLLAFILVCEDLLERPTDLRLFAGAVLLAWAAFYLRYAGIVTVAIGGLIMLAAGWKTRIGPALLRAGAFVVLAASLPVVWMIRNVAAGGDPMGPRAEASATLASNVRRVANEVSQWVATQLAPPAVRALVGAAVVIALAGLVVLLFTRRAQLPDDWRRIVPLALVVVVYTGYLVASASIVAFGAINTRASCCRCSSRPLCSRPGSSRRFVTSFDRRAFGPR